MNGLRLPSVNRQYFSRLSNDCFTSSDFTLAMITVVSLKVIQSKRKFYIRLNTQVLLYTSRFACLLGDRGNAGHLIGHMGKCFLKLLQILVNWDE